MPPNPTTRCAVCDARYKLALCRGCEQRLCPRCYNNHECSFEKVPNVSGIANRFAQDKLLKFYGVIFE